MVRKNYRGSPDTPIEFMDHIEAVFEDDGLIELQDTRKHYLVTIDGCKKAWMKHQQLLEILVGNSPPAEQSDKAMMNGYDSWDFYQCVNQPLYESQVNGLNADQLMIDLGLDASDLLDDSPANRFNG